MNNNAFRPILSGPNQILSYNISANGTSAQQTLPGASSIRIANLGTVTIFINFGTKAVIAVAATDMPIPAGIVEVISLPNGAEYIAAITAGTAATLNIIPGDGV